MKTVYTIGTTAEKIERAIAQVPGRSQKSSAVKNMQDAVLKAAAAAKTGSWSSFHLLAPATICSPISRCEDRCFKELVEGLEA